MPTFFDEMGAYICGDKTAITRAGAIMEANRAERAAFAECLAQELQGDGLELAAMVFGRGPKNEPVWTITVRRLGRYHVIAATIDMARDQRPYDRSLVPSLAAELRRQLTAEAKPPAPAG